MKKFNSEYPASRSRCAVLGIGVMGEVKRYLLKDKEGKYVKM
jgi:hypothetical protein